MQEMRGSERPIEVRVASLEQRLDLLEGVGKEGLPAVRLAAIEVRLDHVEVGVRDLKGEMDRRFTDLKGEMDRHFDGSVGSSGW